MNTNHFCYKKKYNMVNEGVVEKIAQDSLGLETLEVRDNASLDNHI